MQKSLPALPKVFAISFIAGILLFSGFAMTTYGESDGGVLLFEEYFEAKPVYGYGIRRSLAADLSDTDASILRQGISYHQQADYDLAIVSFRAFLESNPEPADDQPLLLAATAAIATGHYAEGMDYLDEITEDDSETGTAANWHQALLHLRKGNNAAALAELQRVKQARAGRAYPTARLLEAIR